MTKQSFSYPSVSLEELKARGIKQPDFVLVSGDAYIDHPSFGPAVITRVLESKGYSVGLISQPDWHDAAAFRALGKPKLAFLVTAGNLDSMVNHYTVAKKRRHKDFYTPGGRMGARPDHAVTVYSNLIRRLRAAPSPKGKAIDRDDECSFAVGNGLAPLRYQS